MVTVESEITDETIEITYVDMEHFGLTYCITLHFAQGISYDFDFSFMSGYYLIHHHHHHASLLNASIKQVNCV